MENAGPVLRIINLYDPATAAMRRLLWLERLSEKSAAAWEGHGASRQQAPGLRTADQHRLKLSRASKHANTLHLQICLPVTAIYTRVASANSRHAAVAVETCSHSEGIRREAGCSLAPLTSLTNWLLYVSGSVRRTGRRWGRRQKNRWIISFAHPGGGSLTHTHMCSSTCDISSMQKKNLLLRWPAELGANEGQGEEERGVGGDERLPEEAR